MTQLSLIISAMYLLQYHTSWTDTFSGDSFDNVSLVDQKVSVDASSFPSRPRQSASKQKAQATDRVSQML